MKPLHKRREIETKMWDYLTSAALNLALEMGLFWDLNQPKSGHEIAGYYSIPIDRCVNWLEILVRLGLLEVSDKSYSNSDVTRSEILSTWSRSSWAFLAREARESYSTIIDLQDHVTHPKSVLDSQNIEYVPYVDRMAQDSKRAEKFTRMLFEIHQPLSEEIANEVDLSEISTLLDLGGGSGIVSFALVKAYPNIHATVYDIETVSKVGRRIAEEQGMLDKVNYIFGNFLSDPLPKDNDVIIYCDVGIYNNKLMDKIQRSLKPNGQLIIVYSTNMGGEDKKEYTTIQNLHYTFLKSLLSEKLEIASIDDVKRMLQDNNFQDIRTKSISEGMILISSKSYI